MKNKKLPILKHFINQVIWGWIVTLTYREENQYRKGHIQFFSNVLVGKGIYYFYVKERTKKGVTHFHILIDKELEKQELASIWNNIVGEELEAGTNINKIKNQKDVINYILQEFEEYGSSLNMEVVHHQTQKVLEEDTIDKSCEKLEEEILKDKGLT